MLGAEKKIKMENYSQILKELTEEGFYQEKKSTEGYECDCEKAISFTVPDCDRLQLFVAVNINAKKVYFYCRYTDGEKIGSNIEIIPEDLEYPFIYWLREKIEERIRY
jgi:hypothetical protein